MRTCTSTLIAATACLATLLSFTDARAQTPACGTTYAVANTTLTFDRDMVCPTGHTGYALTINAQNVTVEGGNFAIVAAANGITAGQNGVTIRNLNVSGPSGTTSGFGINSVGLANKVINVTADNRDTAIRLHGTNAELRNSRARNGRTGAIVGGTGTGGVIVDNNVLTNHRWVNDQWGSSLLIESFSGPITITNNDLRDSSYGIRSSGGISNTTLDNTTGRNVLGNNVVAGIRLDSVTNVVVRGWDVSYTLKQGTGIALNGATNCTVENNVATTRSTGISVDGATSTIRNNNAGNNIYGIIAISGPATIQNNNVTNCSNPGNGDANAGIYLSAFIDKTVVLGGNDYTGSWTGLQANACTNLVIDGTTFTAPERFFRSNMPDVRISGGVNNIVRNLDVSGSTRTGIGVYITNGAVGTRVSNVIANDRAWGVYASGNNHVIDQVEARRCIGGVFLNGTGATVTRSLLTDATNPGDLTNTGGIVANGFTGPLTAWGNDLRRSYQAIHLRGCTNVTLDNAPSAPATPNLVGGNTYGIWMYAGGSGHVVRNWDLSGTDDTGYGVLANSSTSTITVQDVVANNRLTGVYVEGQGSLVERVRANDGFGGVRVSGAATIRNCETRNNRRPGSNDGFGLFVEAYTGALAVTNNTATGNDRGLWFRNVHTTEFDNLEDGTTRLNDLSSSAWGAVWIDGASSRNITVKNVNAAGPTGTRLGYGVYIEGAGNDYTITDVTATNRQYGLYTNTRGLTVNRVNMAGNDYGIFSGSGGPLTITASNLSGNLISATDFRNFRNTTLDLVGNDFRSSAIALRFYYAGPLTIDGAPAGKAANLFGFHSAHGLYSDNAGGPLTIRNMSFRGSGVGYGIYNEGSVDVANVSIESYNIGIRSNTAGSVIRDASVLRCSEGIQLYGGFHTVERTVSRLNTSRGIYLQTGGHTIRANDFTDNLGVAVYYQNGSGAITFAGNDLRRSARALELQGVNDTTFEYVPAGESPNISGTHSADAIYVVGNNISILGPWELTGTGTNTTGVWMSGSGNKVVGARVSRRNFGVSINGPNGWVEGVVADNAFTDGIYITTRGATLKDNFARSALGNGIRVANYTGSIVYEGNDVTGSGYGFRGENTPDIAIDGTPAGLDPNVFGGNFSGAVYLTNAGNSIVRNLDASGTGAGIGVDIQGVNALVENVTARNRSTGIRFQSSGGIARGIYVRDNLEGVRFNGILSQVEGSRICWNSTAGLFNASTDIVDADTNFWGVASGPAVADNPAGTGNTISGRAVYRPWVTEGVGCESTLPVRTLELTGLADAVANTPQTLRVRALDVYGAVVGGYTGTVRLRSTDSNAVLGPNAALVGGVGTFAVTLRTLGNQTVTAQDVASPQINGQLSSRVLVGDAAILVLSSGDAQSGEVARALGAPFRVRVTDLVGNGVKNAQVNFAAVTSGASLSATQVFTDDEGWAQSVGTLSTVSGPHVFTVTSLTKAGTPLTNAPIPLTATALAGPVARLSVAGLPATTVAGSQHGFTVTAQDQYGNTQPTYTGPVVFASDDAQAELPGESALVSGTGTFRTTLKTAGLRRVGAADRQFVNLNGGQVVSVTAGPAATIAIVSGNGQVVEVGTAAPSPLVVEVRDVYGNGVPGARVNFAAGPGASVSATSITTGANGRGQVVPTPGTTAQAYDFDASITATSELPTRVRFQVLAIAGPATNLVYVSGGGLSGRVSQQLLAPLVAMTTDRYGNRVGNVTVNFRPVTMGASVSPASVASDSAGLAQSFATLGPVAGRQQFEASLSGSAVITFDETAVAGDAAGLRLLGGNQQEGRVGTALAEPLRVIVEDVRGNPVPRVAVAFSTTSGTATVTPAFTVTDVNGIASATATYGRKAETISFAATSSGLANSPVAFTAGALAGAASRLEVVSGDAQAGTVGLSLGEPFVVRSTDAFGNVVPSVEVSFSSAEAGAGVSPATVSTGADGLASATATLGTTAGGQVFLAESPDITGVSFAATAAPGAPATFVVLDGEGQEGTVGQALPDPVRVVVRDLHGNAVPGVGIDFDLPGTGASLAPASATTDAAGIAATTATLPHAAGDATIVASIAGESALADLEITATARPGAATHFRVEGIASPVAAGTSSTATVTALDAHENVAIDYAGPATTSTTDSRATLGAAPSFTEGIGTVAVTFQSAGTHAVRVRDVADPTISGEQAGIEVTAAPDLSVVVTVPAGEHVVGTPVRISIQVVDAFGNTVEGARPVTLTADNDATFSGSTLRESAGLGSGELAGLTSATGRAELTLTTLTAGTVGITAGGDGLGSGSGALEFVPANADRLLAKARAATSALACECLTADVSLSDAFGNAVGSTLAGVTFEVSGTATITETTLGATTGTLPAARISGRLGARGGSATLCGDAAERVTFTASHPQLPGRSGTLALDFALGELSTTLTTFVTDATRVQTRQGKATLTLVPKDECGNDLGPGLDVALTTTAGTLGDVVDVGDGSYEATLSVAECPNPASATISATVAGTAVASPLTIEVECIPLSTTNTTLTVSRTTTPLCDDHDKSRIEVLVSPRDGNGNRLGSGTSVSIAVDGLEGGTFTENADGDYAASFSASSCGPDARPVTVSVNGVEVPKDALAVTFACPAIDTDASSVTIERAEIRADGLDATKITAVAVTECAEPAKGRPITFGLALGKVEAAATLDDDGRVEGSVTSMVEGLDSITATVDGTAIGTREVKYRLAVRYGGGFASCGCAGADPASLGLLAAAALLRRRRRASARG